MKEKIRVLENVIIEMRCKREQEHRADDQMVHGFMAKETQWKSEKKRWKEEAAKLWMRLQEKEESIHRLEEEAAMALKGGKEWRGITADIVVQHMREEHAREEAVEKWKRLYLAIKNELDNLIYRTNQGEGFWCGVEEEYVLKVLQRELNAKEETIKSLRMQILAMAREGANRMREIDLLKQSKRILNHTKQTYHGKSICTCGTTNPIKSKHI